MVGWLVTLQGFHGSMGFIEASLGKAMARYVLDLRKGTQLQRQAGKIILQAALMLKIRHHRAGLFKDFLKFVLKSQLGLCAM